MKGLELSRAYFEQVGMPMLEEKFPEYLPRIAAGLVGEGSECLGMDDGVSRDHDWGAGFCLWLTEEDYQAVGEKMQRAYDALPGEFMGYHTRPKGGVKRVGVFSIGQFYQRFIHRTTPPVTLQEWKSIREFALAAATNGEVFYDPLGQFTAFRKALLQFYPQDLWRKKMAACCFVMGQTGQYNYIRSLQRGQLCSAFLGEADFMKQSLRFVYLLNRRYPPFYKWMHPMAQQLPILGKEVYDLCLKLSKTDNNNFEKNVEKIHDMEEFCGKVTAELNKMGLTQGTDVFLMSQSRELEQGIGEEWLRNASIQEEV
jgi:hypothetical protein